MSEGPPVILSADGLMSKWGFGDGDMPDDVWDHLWESGEHDLNWHAVLRILVRRYLLPALEEAGHEVTVYDIETIHNPIRAEMIDGIEIDDYNDNNTNPVLRLDGVTVEWPQVKQAIEEAAAIDTPR